MTRNRLVAFVVLCLSCGSVLPGTDAGTTGGGGGTVVGGGVGGGSGGAGSGGGGSSASFPQQVRLQGTVEVTKRTYDHPGGTVVISRTSKGTFNGVSTSSDLNPARLHYSFAQPFMVTGTQTLFDVTNNPKTCTLNLNGSSGANLELYVGNPASSGSLAQLFGNITTTTSETCPGGASVQNAFPLALPNGDCADPAIQTVSGGKWLVVAGDAHVGFTVTQDFTCDSTIVKISASVQAL